MASSTDGVDQRLILNLVYTLLRQLKLMPRKDYWADPSMRLLFRLLEEWLRIAGSIEEMDFPTTATEKAKAVLGAVLTKNNGIVEDLSNIEIVKGMLLNVLMHIRENGIPEQGLEHAVSVARRQKLSDGTWLMTRLKIERASSD